MGEFLILKSGNDTYIIPLRVNTNELSSLHVALDMRELLIKKNLDNRRGTCPPSSQNSPRLPHGNQALYLSGDPIVRGLSLLLKAQCHQA